MTPKERLEAEVAYVRDCLNNLNAAAETRSFDADEQAKFDEGVSFVRDGLARIKQHETIEQFAAIPAAAETGDDRSAPAFNVNTRTDSDNLFDLRSVDAMGYDRVRGELRSRAATAVERADLDDESKETATRHLESLVSADPETGFRGVAEHILRTGSPEYAQAFEAYVRNPLDIRSALSLTSANGGYLVPFTLDPTIILTNNGATNPFRELATIKTTNTNTWNGVTSAGVNAEWLAEGTEAADKSPTFGQPTITPAKAAAYLFGSYEVLADSDFASDVGMLIADAKDRLEATAFAVGSGSGQPEGVVTGISGITASRVAGSSGAAGSADFVLADVYALANALPPRYRQNSSWLGEQTTLNKVRRFGEGTTANAAFWTDLNMGIPPKLLGRPVYESSEMDNTIVSGSNDDVLVVGDFRHGYYIVDRVGLSVMYNPLVIGASQRPTGQAGWFAFWRVGGKAVDTNAFRMLRL